MTDRKPTCVACKGAGGANYTAGTGIVIEDKEISADTSVLATKTELPDMTDYQPKLTAGTGIDITGNVISCEDGTYVKVTDNDWSKLNLYDSSTKTILRDFIIAFTDNSAVLDVLKFSKGYGGSANLFALRRPYFVLVKETLAGGVIDGPVNIAGIFNSTGATTTLLVSAGGGTDGIYTMTGYSGGFLTIKNIKGSTSYNVDKVNPYNSHSSGVGVILFVKE